VLPSTGLLALRAVLAIAASPREGRLSRDQLAERLAAPSNYLGKVLNQLTKQGVLSSVRGPGGGYRLARDPKEISVLDLFGREDLTWGSSQCLVGGRPCDPAAPCIAHQQWMSWTTKLVGLFTATSVADLLSTPQGRTLEGSPKSIHMPLEETR